MTIQIDLNFYFRWAYNKPDDTWKKKSLLLSQSQFWHCQVTVLDMNIKGLHKTSLITKLHISWNRCHMANKVKKKGKDSLVTLQS